MKQKTTIKQMDSEIKDNHKCQNLDMCSTANLLDLSKLSDSIKYSEDSEPKEEEKL